MCFGVGKKDRQPGTTAVDRAGALNGTATDDAALYDTGMSTTLERVRGLTAVADIKISDHGYDELSKDGLTVGEVVDGLETAEVVEDYPEYGKGPCVLVLQRDARGAPIHALWGIPKGQDRPAVLITAYRPDPAKWTSDFNVRQP